MKIDVEGSELKVLRGLLEGDLNRRPEHIIFEYIPDNIQL